jgi:mono/diheme cytochrome c family protein
MRIALTCALLLAPAAALAAQSPAGRLVAERECGGCHAIGLLGDSRLPDAPPFRALRGRIDATMLSTLLRSRAMDGHPRMPRPRMDPDELAELLAYWDSLPLPKQASLAAFP